jgi:hypothetical protein
VCSRSNTVESSSLGNAHNICGLSDEEILDVVGPSWGAMTPQERADYGPPLALPLIEERQVATVPEALQLVDLAVRFPEGVYEHGLEAVARACVMPPRVVWLAKMVDNYAAADEVDEHLLADETPEPATLVFPMTDAQRIAMGAEHLLAAVRARAVA